MRLIVACQQCRRQYDAKGRRPGSQFRCLCGAVVQVARPRGHDAAVVRCSSCGAPRSRGAAACGHCGSDFTVHERDLHTVCPSCLARVSDRARYCHHCATPLLSGSEAIEKTPLVCPACRPRGRLVSRRLGDYPFAVLECPLCVGLWLSLAELDQLFDSESRKASGIVVGKTATEGESAAGGYRACVVCRELMSRRNFGRGKSGVIVDVCGSHGVWFDTDELSRLIAWARAGGLESARRDLARLRNSPDLVRKRMVRQADRDEQAGRARQSRRVAAAPLTGTESEPRAVEHWLGVLARIAMTTLRR